MRVVLVWLVLLLLFVWGESITPSAEFKANGSVYDIVVDEQYLYAGTTRGALQVFDYKLKKLIKSITVPKIRDFMGDEIAPKILSVDALDGKYLLLSEAKSGYRELYIHENNETKKIISVEQKRTIAKAKFVDENHIFMANLGNDVMLYDITTGKEQYHFQISQSKFSDFALNLARDRAVIGCESGEITLIDVVIGKVLDTLKGQNLDNTYRVAIRKNRVTGAGQDRRGSYYNISTGSGGYFEGSFLIYATALSPSGALAAYAMDEDNSISIYSLSKQKRIDMLKGQKSTLNTIVFLNETTLFSASSDPTIIMWQLPTH